MRMLTLEVDHGERAITPHVRHVDDSRKLEGFYHYLGCERIDMATIDVDGHSYDVICDDEYLLRCPLIPTLYVSDEQVFFGNIGFVKVDDEGGSVGLDDEDVARLVAYINRQNSKMQVWIGKVKTSCRENRLFRQSA